MNIAMINMTVEGSTGRIMLDIASQARNCQHKVWTYSPYPLSKHYKKKPDELYGHMFYGTWIGRKIHNIIGRIFGCNGKLSFFDTLQLIRDMKNKKIEIIHLHNLHSYCINFPILFRFIKKHNVKVIWTLHDCWTFTGHCPHFEMIGCEKWKYGCCNCPQIYEYPQSLVDNSKNQYHFKKKWFTDIKNMIIVTPSVWLADKVKQSFLRDYQIRVINNGIDISVFKPMVSDFREKFNLQEKFILLGVSFSWGKKKGLDVFEELAKRLDPSIFQIVLIGVSSVEKESLPVNILSVNRTDSMKELASIYSTADIFINPTREDTYPTVNMESIACGTPVLSFNAGGSPEILNNETGLVVPCDDVDALEQSILHIYINSVFCKEKVAEYGVKFNKTDRFKEYVRLYEETQK